MDKDLTKGKGMTVGETQIGTVHNRGIFNLGEMPMALLDEAWHRYHPYTMTKNHRNRLSTIRKVAKSDCAQQIREVKQAIKHISHSEGALRNFGGRAWVRCNSCGDDRRQCRHY